MRPGSVTVDLAAEQGGNIATTVPDEVITTNNARAPPNLSSSLKCAGATVYHIHCGDPGVPQNGCCVMQGVICIGYTNLPARLPTQSSTLYVLLSAQRSMHHPITNCLPASSAHGACRMSAVRFDNAGCPTTSPSSCCPPGPSPRRPRAASMWTTRTRQCAAPWSPRMARSCGRRRRSRCSLAWTFAYRGQASGQSWHTPDYQGMLASTRTYKPATPVALFSAADMSGFCG
jgi:Alanine dehydrogenase/PNT, C-terminal domain